MTDQDAGLPPIRPADEPKPDVAPEDTVPDMPPVPNPQAQPGSVLPPLAGWGEPVTSEEPPNDEPPDTPA